MKQLLDKYQHLDPGYNPFLITPTWQVAQLNFSEDQLIENINRVDIHHHTDEVFILLVGEAVLITAEVEGAQIAFQGDQMEHGITYNVPEKTWHNIAMKAGSKVIIVEDSNTHLGDFEFYDLNEDQKRALIALVTNKFEL